MPTSWAGRFQFSVEKAYRVRCSMPASEAASRMSCTARTPSLWPLMRGQPRCSAQRPLPSMIRATWRGMLMRSP